MNAADWSVVAPAAAALLLALAALVRAEAAKSQVQKHMRMHSCITSPIPQRRGGSSDDTRR